MSLGKVLLVEDNEDDLTLMLRAFRIKKITNEIVVARNGVEALDLLLGTNGKIRLQPCLVIPDLKLPKINGIEVLQKIQKSTGTRDYPVIILTTSTEQEDIVKSYDPGANSYIRKPVEFDRFSEAVGQLGLYRLSLNEPDPRYHD